TAFSCMSRFARRLEPMTPGKKTMGTATAGGATTSSAVSSDADDMEWDEAVTPSSSREVPTRRVSTIVNIPCFQHKPRDHQGPQNSTDANTASHSAYIRSS